MTNEERLKHLEYLKSQPPFDLTQPLELPQDVIETMARCLLKIVRKE